MPSFYPYLIASLPLLHFEARPPFSCEKFILRCKEFIPESDFHLLQNLTLQDTKSLSRPIIKQWLDFDTGLRNELVKVRAEHKKIDPARYLRPDGYANSSLYHTAI